MDFQIDEQFEKLLPRDEDAYRILKEQIEAEGLKETIKVWRDEESVPTVIDGHTRLQIANELGLSDVPFEYVTGLKTRGDVMRWMWRNQAGRRNLTPQALKKIRAEVYEAELGVNLTPEKDYPAYQPPTDNLTSEGGCPDCQPPTDNLSVEASGAEIQEVKARKVAEDFGVSERTIYRDHRFRTALKSLPQRFREAYDDGSVKVPESVVVELASLPEAFYDHYVDGLLEGKTWAELTAEEDPPVLDREKQGVPESLVPVFRNWDYQGQVNAVLGVQRWFNEKKTTPSGELLLKNRASIKASLENLLSAIRHSAPHAVCPYCKGKDRGRPVPTCEACKGLGYVTKYQWKQAPDQVKNASPAGVV